jgi:N-acetylglucosamine malate deacetylase 1
MNVLVLAPHPDDEAIGCGGTIARHRANGDRVVVAFLSSGELGLGHLPRQEAWEIREGEAASAAEVLGISGIEFLRRPDWYLSESADEAAALLRPVLERDRPQRIYLPHPGEWHPDHQACLTILSRALEESSLRPPSLFGYEVWTPLSEYDLVKDVTETMGRKLQAIRCYRSQLGHFRYDRAVRGLNAYRGGLAGRCGFAEVFQSLVAGRVAPAAACSLAGEVRP